MRKEEDVVQYIGLAVLLSVGMCSMVQLASSMLYIPPLLCSFALLTLKMVTATYVSQENGTTSTPCCI